MQNLVIEKSKITWETTKMRFGSEVKYRNEIINHGDHVSICKTMFINGEYNHTDLAHIPIELIDKIKSLEPLKREIF